VSRLAGMRVMLTRPKESSQDLARALRAEGAIVANTPLIRIAEPSNPEAFRAAVDSADSADWLVFTSANGVAAFARRRNSPLAPRVRIGVVGPATAAAVQVMLHRAVDVIPQRHDAEALATTLLAAAKPRASLLVVQPEGAQSGAASRLEAAGCTVRIAHAYRTFETPPSDVARLVARADAIVLMSGSQARALARGLGETGQAALRHATVIAVGGRTEREAVSAGVRVNAVADDAAPSAIAAAIAAARKR